MTFSIRKHSRPTHAAQLAAVLAASAVFPLACADEFTSCEDTLTCKSNGGGSDAEGGDGGDNGLGGSSGGTSGSGASTNGGAGGESGPDTTAPAFVSSTPADSDTGVERDGPLTVVFSEPLAAASVTSDSVALLLDGDPVDASIDADGDTIVITPSSRLALLGDYEIVVDPEITDEAGNVLEEEARVAFQVRDGVLSVPRRIDVENLGDVGNFDLKSDNRGNVVAVWDQHDGTRKNIWWSRWDGATGEWTAAALLETDTAESSMPCLAFNEAGQGIATWSRGRKSSWRGGSMGRRGSKRRQANWERRERQTGRIAHSRL